VAQAFQYATNTMWGVPRNNRPNPPRARGRSLVLLGTAGLAFLVTTALTILGSVGGGFLGTATRVIALAVSVVAGAALFVFAFRFAAARRLSVRDVVPGALAAEVIWQLLQTFGVIFVRQVSHASPTNVKRMYPRSLLTPFTDNVILTAADRRSYSRQARAQRSKGFEHVSVYFDTPSPVSEPAEPDNPSDQDEPDG
jgi:hypothetical protein